LGHRTTFATGWAVYELGQNLIRLLKERAAGAWQVSRGGGFCGWQFSCGEKHLTFNELVARLGWSSPVVASAASTQWSGSILAVHIADVEVDPETGQVKLLRYTAVQDVGKAIHPCM